MRFAVLCGSSSRSQFVANALCAKLDVGCIVSEVGREYSWRKLRKHLKPATWSARIHRTLRPRLFPPDVDQDRVLFGDRPPRFVAAGIVHRVSHINSPECVRVLDEARVDALAVFGTSLLRDPALLDRGDGRVFNLHGGQSPWYRGADSTFWALYEGEPERIGCTVHVIERRIDAGKMLARCRPAVRRGQRETALDCEAIMLGARVFAEALARVACGERLGIPQPAGGRLYNARDRRWKHDRLLRRLYARCRRGESECPQHIEWFAADRAGVGAVPQPRMPSSSIRTEYVGGSACR